MTPSPYLRGITDHIRARDLETSVVGLGTIGLVLATFLAKAGFTVVGLDINPSRIEQVNSGNVSFEFKRILSAVLAKRKLRATSNPKEAVSRANVIFVCVPTSLGSDKTVDTRSLRNAAERIGRYMRRGVLVIIESTVPIGMTRELGKVLERRSGMRMGRDFGLACCPERYNPSLSGESHPTVMYQTTGAGNVRHSFDQLARVVGGVDEESAVAAQTLYKRIIKAEVMVLSSPEAAEATKLLENIFRDVNIALINGLAKTLPNFGVDVYEIIEAAKTKPFTYYPHYPGPGVGGECIPVVPWFLINQVEKVGLSVNLLRKAREVNDSMPLHVVSLLEEQLRKLGKGLESARVTVMGIAYKKNINDVRQSPGLSVVKILEARKSQVRICDPIVAEYPKDHKLSPLSEAFRGADAAVLVTDHDVFRNLDFGMMKREMRTPIMIDGRHLFDAKAVKAGGFYYKCLGVP